MIEFGSGKKLDKASLVIIVTVIIVLIALRVFTGSVFDSRRVLKSIERELIAEYTQSVYAQRDDNDLVEYTGDGSGMSQYVKLNNLEIELTNISMSAPLYSWSAKENVGVCFDYEISTDEGIVESEKRIYKKVTREKGYHVWDSNVFFYYMTYILG